MTLTTGIGPIPVAAGQELTECIVIPLNNTEDVVVNGFDINLAPGSHHLIVYLTDDTEALTPFACTPFAGIALGTDTPLVLANKLQETWTFPSGVAQDVPAQAMVKIEAHYINASANAIQGMGSVVFHAVPKASAPPYQPASFIFWGTSHIDIPPNGTFQTPQLFQQGIHGTQLTSITTHQHELGTGIQAWASAQQGDMSNRIADDLDWANPSWRLLAPSFAFNGTSGLTFQCSWANTTSQTVTFGESALDEMCFVGGYYYPASALDLCINDKCKLPR